MAIGMWRSLGTKVDPGSVLQWPNLPPLSVFDVVPQPSTSIGVAMRLNSGQ